MLNSSFKILKGSKSSKKQTLFVLDDCLMAGQYIPNRFRKDWEHAIQDLREYVRGKAKNILIVDVSRTLDESKRLYEATISLFDAIGVEPQYMSLGTYLSVPPLLKILQVSAMMYNWISNGMKERECRVVLVLGTCDIVSMKTVSLMVSAYWLFVSKYNTGIESLEHFMKKAKVYHNFSAADVQPRIETSHVVRLLNCITQLKSSMDVPRQILINLKKTLIVGTVYLPGRRPWNPILRLYSGRDEYSEDYKTICQMSTSPQDSQVGESYVNFILGIPMYGDFTLSFEHWEEMAQHTIPIFTIFCHASFLTPSSRRFNRNEIEIYPELALGVDVDSLEYIDLHFDELVDSCNDKNDSRSIKSDNNSSSIETEKEWEAKTYLNEINYMLQRAPEYPPKRRYLERNYSNATIIASNSTGHSSAGKDPLVKELIEHFKTKYYNESENKSSRVLLDSGRPSAEFEMEWFYEAFERYLDELSQYRNGYTENDRKKAVKKALLSRFPATASLIETLDDHSFERALRKVMQDEESSSYDGNESDADYSICSPSTEN
ncbi:actin binding protein [Galdieria sulphuraria]|uniref:Actin binding protein n=1 Tax=Galdieria sulphuraria TaxID=130081 RepID=M2W3F4_GALSU|nr:actin binding protein [Galdieria sulphuraria]EME30236.1 actin binding protein [Galdieria sulphuraria]|eukprot:XP_005706756.1 actin binding protein [Galdieria sulphuraria]